MRCRTQSQIIERDCIRAQSAPGLNLHPGSTCTPGRPAGTSTARPTPAQRRCRCYAPWATKSRSATTPTSHLSRVQHPTAPPAALALDCQSAPQRLPRRLCRVRRHQLIHRRRPCPAARVQAEPGAQVAGRWGVGKVGCSHRLTVGVRAGLTGGSGCSSPKWTR
jgi:hypothetical protein